MMYRCLTCRAEFDTPSKHTESQDEHSEVFEFKACPECGSEEIEEVHDWLGKAKQIIIKENQPLIYHIMDELQAAYRQGVRDGGRKCKP
jgi:DNA-directed RNA polymerase subunit RPC12/RpoP